jgi:HEPN domain-containing protein
MSSWQRGKASVGQLLANGALEMVTGAAANGLPWLAKARRTLATAASAADTDADSAFTLAYDAARFACTALLTQQGLRPTTRGGHYAVEVAVREQFGGKFNHFGALRRQRNDIEYPRIVSAQLTNADAESAVGLAQQLTEAAQELLPNLRLFRS